MEKYVKRQLISALKDGDAINDIFVVKIKKSVSPYAKGYSITLVLSDSSGGSVEYKYWGGAEENKVKGLFNLIQQDSIILITGKVSSYQGKLQISANETDKLDIISPDECDVDFIMPPRKDTEDMYSQLASKINSISNVHIKKLLNDIIGGELKEKLKKHPAAIQIHHNWKGGLLQHILEIIEYCETSAKLNPELNRDLLIAGAVLHDIGKLEEIEVTSRIKAGRKGQLVGHLVLGAVFLSEKLQDSGIDQLLQEKLLHLIVSHHGKEEYGSPKKPMFAEAVALHYADELSSRLAAVLELIRAGKESTQDEFVFDFKDKINLLLR